MMSGQNLCGLTHTRAADTDTENNQKAQVKLALRSSQWPYKTGIEKGQPVPTLLPETGSPGVNFMHSIRPAQQTVHASQPNALRDLQPLPAAVECGHR